MPPRSTRLFRASLFCSAIFAVSPLAIAADDMKPPATSVRVMLSGLPERESNQYQILRAKADPASLTSLDMTRSEVWTLAPERLTSFSKAAEAVGVTVSPIGKDWNHPLEGVPRGDGMTPTQSGMMSKAMESKAAMGMAMMTVPDARLIEYALTSPDGVEGEAGTIILPLTATQSVSVTRKRLERTADGYIWHGTVAGSEDPVTLIWHKDGRLSGQITSGLRTYSIRHLGGGLHGVIELQSRMLPADHAPMDEILMQKMKMREDPLATKGDAGMVRPHAPRENEPIENLQDASSGLAHGAGRVALGPSVAPAMPDGAPVTITVLVAYTKRAASYFSDIAQDLVELAIEDTNQSFRNSGIGNVQLQLVHAYQTDYVESGTHFEHVFRFADRDGVMDDVLDLRERYQADVAVLIVHDSNGCGLAAGVAPPEDRAFAVVSQECAATKYSIGHEIGHIIGARHDLALDDSTMPFPYGHGFVSGSAWRTMMSYENSCGGCPRLPVWSNPRVQVRGTAAGDASADNARVIAEQAARVAAFR